MDDDVALTFAGIFGFAFLFTLFCLAIPYYYDARDWYAQYKAESEMMEIDKLKDKIARVEYNLAKDKKELETLRTTNRTSRFGRDYVSLVNLIKSGEFLLCRLKREHNRWQWENNGFLMGTSLQKDLLLECSV